MTYPFLHKLSEHLGGGIALVHSRTDTAWFHEIMNSQNCYGVMFTKGRIKFHAGDKDAPVGASPTVGSALLAFGSRAARAVQFSGLGLWLERP